jgi:hypothetical protein
MSEVILRLDDTSDLDKIMRAISPYFQTVSIVGFTDQAKQENSLKIWDGKADWLDNPWKTTFPFKPLTKDEAHAR